MGGRGRIGAVGRVRADDLGFAVALVRVVGRDGEHAGQLAVRAGHGVAGVNSAMPVISHSQRSVLVHDRKRPLGELVAARQLGQQGMQP